MRIIAIIPARVRSQRLPGKNLMRLRGKTLVRLAIDSARCPSVDRAYLSSDDDVILSEAESTDAVPLLRPADLATDDATTDAVIRHVLEEDARRHPLSSAEAVCLLQPTSPLRTAVDVEMMIRWWAPRPHRPARSVHAVGGWPNGAIYLATASQVVQLGDSVWAGAVMAWPMSPERSIDVDRQEDLDLARWVLDWRP